MPRAARLSIRLDFGEPGDSAGTARLGPGKIALLEQIRQSRSLAGAAREMGMSYKRAWELLSTLNEMFDEPVAVTQPGRNVGGGTELTPFGERVVALYRAIERRAQQAGSAGLEELNAAARAAHPGRWLGRREAARRPPVRRSQPRQAPSALRVKKRA
jgi:molybdate transport system regulatory protein